MFLQDNSWPLLPYMPQAYSSDVLSDPSMCRLRVFIKFRDGRLCPSALAKMLNSTRHVSPVAEILDIFIYLAAFR